jgi:hypothetical protein
MHGGRKGRDGSRALDAWRSDVARAASTQHAIAEAVTAFFLSPSLADATMAQNDRSRTIEALPPSVLRRIDIEVKNVTKREWSRMRE